MPSFLKQKTKHIRVKVQGLLLALLIFIAFGAKEWHIVVEHNHFATEICDAKAGDLHLHAYENLAHECSLCDFTFSLFELQFSCFYLNDVEEGFFERDFNYTSFFFSSTHFFLSLRGPPCFFKG